VTHREGDDMAAPITTPMTAEEFFEWANRPENAGRRLELENGRVVEMPSPGELHGLFCWLVTKVLTDYVFRRGIGYLLTNDSGLLVRRNPDTVRGPDVMVQLESRSLDQMSRKFSERVPELIVEVFSPSDKPSRLTRRIAQYHKRGVPLVWGVYPDDRSVDVYRPNTATVTLEEADELAAPDVLPDFSCRVADLFTLPGQPPAAS
jgi:Uma2 family endonuclease